MRNIADLDLSHLDAVDIQSEIADLVEESYKDQLNDEIHTIYIGEDGWRDVVSNDWADRWDDDIMERYDDMDDLDHDMNDLDGQLHW